VKKTGVRHPRVSDTVGSDPISSVLRAIALSRTPGLNFPGHFLRVSFDRVAADRSLVSLDTTPACATAGGEMSLGAFALLADIGLATSFRGSVGPSARVATVSMSLTFTGAPRVGRLTAESWLDGFVEGAAEKQGLARVEIRSGKSPVATGSGSFMVIGKPNATAPHPLPKRGDLVETTVAADELTDAEAQVLGHARKSLRAARDGNFIERFWGYQPRATASGASCKAWNGPHVGNRVGHAQGGFTFGLAATTAMKALPEHWKLVGASSWYIGPGIGRFLTARSRILHRGMSTAVVRTRIEDENRRGVLETVTSHAR
jgi:acyl-coenzyme A thioesterase PaaI-like protein